MPKKKMNDKYEHLNKLLREVTLLIEKHGSRSEEVQNFVQKHAKDEPELPELVATKILIREGELEEDSE